MLKVVTKGMFLDQPKVLRRLGEKKRRILNTTGFNTWKRMRDRMRPRPQGKKYRPRPKSPPRAGPNPLLKRLLRYGLEDHNETVIIGPLARRAKHTSALRVPQLLNEGGTATIRLPGITDEDGKYTPGRQVKARYRAFPFATEDSPAYMHGLKTFKRLTEKTPL